MRLNEAGRMVLGTWEALPMHYPSVDVDAFVVMPNHLHGIIFLGSAPDHSDETARIVLSLPDVVQRFKSLTTARYRAGVLEHGWPPFPRRLWQRGYYEHIIRHDRSLSSIRRYIEDNPSRWPSDEENPHRS
jgi:REP element-mobilizing transposase RayT